QRFVRISFPALMECDNNVRTKKRADCFDYAIIHKIVHIDNITDKWLYPLNALLRKVDKESNCNNVQDRLPSLHLPVPVDLPKVRFLHPSTKDSDSSQLLQSFSFSSFPEDICKQLMQDQLSLKDIVQKAQSNNFFSDQYIDSCWSPY